MIKSFTAKLGNMRKAREWVAYPRKSASDPVIVQCDIAIGRFDPVTGCGVFNFKGNKFIHLQPICGSVGLNVPEDFVKLAVEASAVSADGTVTLT